MGAPTATGGEITGQSTTYYGVAPASALWGVVGGLMQATTCLSAKIPFTPCQRVHPTLALLCRCMHLTVYGGGGSIVLGGYARLLELLLQKTHLFIRRQVLHATHTTRSTHRRTHI
eukprot:51752-Eustigmatos_ZCMA.PRE.1